MFCRFVEVRFTYGPDPLRPSTRDKRVADRDLTRQRKQNTHTDSVLLTLPQTYRFEKVIPD